MAASKKDPTGPIRLKASRYPCVDEGTACTQSSFKTGKRAFLCSSSQVGDNRSRVSQVDNVHPVTDSAPVQQRQRILSPKPRKISGNEKGDRSTRPEARAVTVRINAMSPKASRKSGTS